MIPDEAKFAELLLYVAKKTLDDPSVGTTKLNKLLYFAEFSAVRLTGEPITGVEYQKLDNGPAPRRLIPIREQLVRDGAAELQQATYFGNAQQRLVPLREPDLSDFSDDEIATIDQVTTAMWGKAASELSELSHREMGWAMVGDKETIPYDAAFVSPPKLTAAIQSRGAELAKQFNLS